MYRINEIKYIKALSPVHAGSGQDLGFVDMPIQREKHSGIPKIEGSSLKGSMKHYLFKVKDTYTDEEKRNEFNNKIERVFGPEKGEDFASAIAITDAKLLLFPVRSDKDIFKLITCPYVVNRWLGNIGEETLDISIKDGTFKDLDNKNDRLIMEEYLFKCAEDSMGLEELKANLNDIAGVDTGRVVVISDSDFIDMVTMYTEVITRNRIDHETGTAQGTGLFTEEYLPAETVMYFNVLSAPAFGKNTGMKVGDVKTFFNDNIKGTFQVGGNSTIGKGFVKLMEVTKVEHTGK